MKWLGLAALCGCSLAVQAGLTAVERTLQASVDAIEPQYLALLERVVNINSGTHNHAGVKAVADEFVPAFEALGFTTQWHDGSAFNRAGHLLARRGKQGPKILLIGHLDTVFAPQDKFQRWQPLADGRVKGPGITDMKGGNVVMLMALHALQDAGVLDQLQIQVVLTGDEEARGEPIELAVAPLLAAGDWADVALGFEDGDSDPATAVIARRGSASWRLEVSGKPAHSSQVFREDVGFGAVYEMARVLNAFRTELSDQPLLTYNPGFVLAGTDVEETAASRGRAFGKANVIAATALVEGDLRAISPASQTAAWARMQAIASASLPHTKSVFTYQERYPPMAPTPGNEALLALYSQASEDLGHGVVVAVDPRRAGAADISFVAGRVAMALDGLGLMGEGGHTPDEIANMATLRSQSQRAALLMYRLSQRQNSANAH
ncbi:peptidase M20 [Simiduia agarivorans SA1 = DSM 21679]|uniref:Peptidase M20 n=2 Tax=Simiduia TaxID=447467 RepID=K4KRW4_SIMAS|nr:peptidase M20 [Simiduia agarivorans SA1 = DSM 21679]